MPSLDMLDLVGECHLGWKAGYLPNDSTAFCLRATMDLYTCHHVVTQIYTSGNIELAGIVTNVIVAWLFRQALQLCIAGASQTFQYARMHASFAVSFDLSFISTSI